MLATLGPQELLIIGIVLLVVVFGAKKIPEMARSMGRAQSEFKKGVKEGQVELGETPAAAPSAAAPASPPPTEVTPAAPAATEATAKDEPEPPSA